MKPFLGIDRSIKHNCNANGTEFLVAEPNSVTADAVKHSAENVEQVIEKSKLALPLRIVQCVCGIAGLMLLCGILKAFNRNNESSLTLAQACQNAPWIFWLCGICLLVWAIFKILGAKNQTRCFQMMKAHTPCQNLARLGTQYSKK